MEIPLIYTGRHETPRIFSVSPLDLSVRSVPDDASARSSGGYVDGADDLPFVMDECLYGCASVSDLTLRGRKVLLTTSALMDSPGVISVSISKMQDPLDSPITSRIDLRELIGSGRFSGLIVKIKAFVQGEGILSLVIVDSNASFLRIDFTDSLLPSPEPASVLSVSDYVKERPVMELISGSEVQSNMVAFISSDDVCVALSPFLFTVNLQSGTSTIWSETKTLEDMKSRAFSLGSILHHASDLIIGKTETGILDMPPTAALCLASMSNPLLDPNIVFTLHSDASVRKWVINPQSSPSPMEVAVLDLKANDLASPSTWDDTRNTASLCARLYQQVYALSVQIKTIGEQSTGRSKCRLWAIHADIGSKSNVTCLPLSVPAEAATLVGMDFVPTQSRCSLDAVFESNAPTGMMHITYPPSIVSIMSSAPIVKTFQGSLDYVAGQERSRIERLSFGEDIIQASSSAANVLIDKDLHEIDSHYMKHLFRPIFPRGNGTALPPSELTIRKSISKLVKRHRLGIDAGIELATLRAVYEWRSRDNRNANMSMRRRLSYSSANEEAGESHNEEREAAISTLTVYDSFVGNTDDINNEDDIMDADVNVEEDLSESDRNWAHQVEEHENRWRKLLLQVWEEERMTRAPLSCTWMESSASVVCIRAGLVTVLIDSPGDQSDITTPEAILDETALKLLERIETNPSTAKRLYKMEQRTCYKIATARLALEDIRRSGLVQELTALGKWAWSGEGSLNASGGLSDAEHERLEQAASKMTAGDLIQWIHKVPERGSFSSSDLGLVVNHQTAVTSNPGSNSRNQVASCQLRHSVCSVSTRCVDSMRRLQLGRCLLLMDLIEGDFTSIAAVRAYLHTLSVLWVIGQHIPMPSTTLLPDFGSEAEEGSPALRPNKRLSFGDDSLSILSPSNSTLTTVIDAQIIRISQKFDETNIDPYGPISAYVDMVKSALRLALSSEHDSDSLLPELDILSRESSDSSTAVFPKLELRLLSPFIAITLPKDLPDLVLLRKELLAECFLIESHGTPRSEEERSLYTLMNQKACSVLVPSGFNDDGAIGHDTVRSAFQALESMETPHGENVSDEDIEFLLTEILYGDGPGLIVEVKRLCKLETVQHLFAPLVTEPELFDGVTGAAIRMLANVFLHLSRLMNRLEVLERHAGRPSASDGTGGSTTLLEFADSAIHEMNSLFPPDIASTMPEYIQLWSSLFNHSVLARNWAQAYRACVGNPVPEKRGNDLRRLVRGMVDSGSLDELLHKCSSLDINTMNADDANIAEGCVNLYEIASEVLAESASSDIYSLRASSPDPSNLSDYQGALYSLHASQQQWRKAAQAMDMRFENARSAWTDASSSIGRQRESKALLDGLIVEDLILSSTSSVNAIELIKDISDQYIVSGELDTTYLALSSVIEQGSGQNKRPRSPSGMMDIVSDAESDTDDRISRFMTYIELQARAVRSVCVRALFLDRSVSFSISSSLASRDIRSSHQEVAELFQLGYYHYGLLLGHAMKINYERQLGRGSANGENNIFSGILTRLACGNLTPHATTTLSDPERPSITQLYDGIDAANTLGDSAKLVSIRSGHSLGASFSYPEMIKTASMLLLQKITTNYTSAAIPLAMNVARSVLSHSGQLPPWLYSLLAGPDSDYGIGFNRPSISGCAKYRGDPSGLLSLYINLGMILEACDLVVAILKRSMSPVGGTSSNASTRKSRLPEKGDIDCVPLKKVDILWNLIDAILHRGSVPQKTAKSLKKSQEELEGVIKDYFAFLKRNDMGMVSARALEKGLARQ